MNALDFIKVGCDEDFILDLYKEYPALKDILDELVEEVYTSAITGRPTEVKEEKK